MRMPFCTLPDLRLQECSFSLICGYSGTAVKTLRTTLKAFRNESALQRHLGGGGLSGTLPAFRILHFQKSRILRNLNAFLRPKLSQESIWQGPVASFRVLSRFRKIAAAAFHPAGPFAKEGRHTRSRFCTLPDLRLQECSFSLICGHSGTPVKTLSPLRATPAIFHQPYCW